MKETEIHPANNYPEPSPELIEDIRKRLAEIPPDVAQYVDEALRREPIERVANFMWKAGHPVLMSSDLYEYRRTLFPPGAMVEPYTAGPPVLRQESTPAISPISPISPSAPPQHEPLPAETEPSIHPTIHSSADATLNPQPSSLNSSAGAALLNELRDVIKRYVVLPEMAAET